MTTVGTLQDTHDQPQWRPGQVQGRVALVTGGTRGIGAAICRALAADGADVAAGYWRGDDDAKFLASMTADYPGRRFTVHEGNIADADDCRRVLAEAIDQHGRVDILVNNAGITVDRTVAKMTDEDWQKVIAVNRAQRPVGDGIGLTVNAITPGYIETGMLATVPDKVLDRLRTQIPVGRLGAPEEIARVVCFLAADSSAYVTGQIWAVNGGQDM